MGWLWAGVLLACAPALTEVRVEESSPTLVADHEVAVASVMQLKRFRQGKRISVMAATLIVRERDERRKVQVAEGDDIVIGGKRWLVSRIEKGGPTTRGVVVLASQN